MKPIAVVPPWPRVHGNNALFEHPGFREWKTAAAARGFELLTHDLCPPEQATVLWCVDLSESVLPLWAIRNARRAGARLVLQILESPLVRPRSWVQGTHQFFERVLTYNPRHSNEAKYRRYRIPVALHAPTSGPAFASRRVAVMVNTNLRLNVAEIRSARHSRDHLATPLTIAGAVWDIWRAQRTELYSWRRRLARTAEDFPPGTLDIYGSGWRDLPGSHGEPGERDYDCAAKAPAIPAEIRNSRPGAFAPKQSLIAGYRFSIATENYRGDVGYISEKIFDPMLAGHVPVYLGDRQIESVVPKAAFVDARRFRTQHQLLDYLTACPEAEWLRMKQAGADWIQSRSAQQFSGAAFAATATRILEEIVP